MASALFVGATVGSTAPALALEYPIGKPQIRAGMEVSAVYLQPVPMEPDGMMRLVRDSDIHLEADIKAQSDNPNDFPDGTFIPYLDVHYEIAKDGSAEPIRGQLMPMVANDGPHYGDNVKLQGTGKYHLRITVAPPGSHFGRHTDKETGVIEVPANTRFKIEIENEGSDPVEFESTELHIEKVLAGGAKSYVVINGLQTWHVHVL